MELEFTDGARIWIEECANKTARLYAGDFSALINAPMSAGIVETLVYIAQELKVDPKAISEFFASQHYKLMPFAQLSARLYAVFKQRLRCNADKLPATEAEREEKYSGLMFDVQHAAACAFIVTRISRTELWRTSWRTSTSTLRQRTGARFSG